MVSIGLSIYSMGVCTEGSWRIIAKQINDMNWNQCCVENKFGLNNCSGFTSASISSKRAPFYQALRTPHCSMGWLWSLWSNYHSYYSNRSWFSPAPLGNCDCDTSLKLWPRSWRRDMVFNAAYTRVFDIMTPIQSIDGKCIVYHVLHCQYMTISNIIKPALEFIMSSRSHELRAIGSTFLCWRTWWRRLEWHSFPLGDAAKYLTISHWMLQGSIHYFTNCTLIASDIVSTFPAENQKCSALKFNLLYQFLRAAAAKLAGFKRKLVATPASRVWGRAICWAIKFCKASPNSACKELQGWWVVEAWHTDINLSTQQSWSLIIEIKPTQIYTITLLGMDSRKSDHSSLV